MKTGCTAPDGTIKAIGDVIYEELSDKYIIVSRILNFKNYGSNSSRTRTVVISFRERNSYNFLCLYIEKVLKDSGIYRMFEYFFRLQDKNSFKEL